MGVEELRRELALEQQKLLKERHKRRLQERRLQREEQRAELAVDPIRATSLTSVESVTSRPGAALEAVGLSEVEMRPLTATLLAVRLGFLRQQLAVAELTPLRRWSVQLKLLEAREAKLTTGGDSVNEALKGFEETLARDRRCFDVVYRAGARVTDARGTFVDEGTGVSPMNVRELLSFSTRCESVVCRVTCLNCGDRVVFTSSEYVNNLQKEFEHLVSDGRSVDEAISFIWRSLEP